MIDFPASTCVCKRLPKEAFYQHLELTNSLKNKFVSDIEQIAVENTLTKDNLNLSKDAPIKEIMLLSLTLKKQNFDAKIAEVIARQNPHKLVFQFVYDDKRQFAVYHSRLYRSEWISADKLNLTLSGDNLDSIWDDLVRQVAIHSECILRHSEASIDEQLKMQNEIDSLSKLITKTENAVIKEKQPKHKFDLYTRLQKYKEQLNEITNR